MRRRPICHLSVPIRPLSGAMPRRAFSFIEILFALAVLGVGFIMIAAIFPVALQQTKLTVGEAAADRMKYTAESEITQAFSEPIPTGLGSPNWPPQTGDSNQTPPLLPKYYYFRDSRMAALNSVGTNGTGMSDPNSGRAMWDAIKGRLLLSTDAHYAYVPLFSRDAAKGNSVNLIVIAVRNDARPYSTNPDAAGPGSDVARYSAGVISDNPGLQPTTLEPLMTDVVLTEGGNNPDTIYFPIALDSPKVDIGTYVVISDDKVAGADAGKLNGLVCKVGQPIDPAKGLWQLEAGVDLSLPDTHVSAGNDNLPPAPMSPTPLYGRAGTPAKAFIVGKAWQDPKNPIAGVYEGAAQDIKAYRFTITTSH